MAIVTSDTMSWFLTVKMLLNRLLQVRMDFIKARDTLALEASLGVEYNLVTRDVKFI